MASLTRQEIPQAELPALVEAGVHAGLAWAIVAFADRLQTRQVSAAGDVPLGDGDDILLEGWLFGEAGQLHWQVEGDTARVDLIADAPLPQFDTLLTTLVPELPASHTETCALWGRPAQYGGQTRWEEQRLGRVPLPWSDPVPDSVIPVAKLMVYQEAPDQPLYWRFVELTWRKAPDAEGVPE